jgi:hypothetical protein
MSVNVRGSEYVSRIVGSFVEYYKTHLTISVDIQQVLLGKVSITVKINQLLLEDEGLRAYNGITTQGDSIPRHQGE